MTNSSSKASKRSQRPSAIISLVAAMTATVLGVVGAITAFVTETQEISKLIAVEDLVRLESTIKSNIKKIESLEEHLRQAGGARQAPKGPITDPATPRSRIISPN